ncbi:MAG: bifunctional oligoribonuclease/PAP phosphatase NrnA [Candidatus Omnitrophica bacterium]|nr:bifunctional oligoribonuclease/PAP phosphatase NrnA [Candidatus Omnitrophota bacterium]MBU4478223.1 bifunctional oligoribonuclease/PAP phosphatase NrnA [Candidatus Omnitrophota bacterium]MCG2703377.1 bifunctional oligoribonuclease/PAP phosphatase NrnA [Candidatus Omnitrophota bacterium]
MIKKQILEIIKQYQRFLIVAHIHPEGDSIGSQIAMANLLKTFGKSVRIINADAVPGNLAFLPGIETVESGIDAAVEDITFDAAVILDCPTLERIGKVKQLLGKGEYIINIDHHISNEHFGNINWVDFKASSVGEMVYGLFKGSNIPLDGASAQCIYVAIMTDTGSFHYSNTTAATHKIAAELLQYNINPTKVYEYIYETKSFETLKLLAEVLSNLQRSKDGKFVWFKVTDAMLKRNKLSHQSTDDFIDFVRMVEGAEVVAFLREVSHGNTVKVSLRSKTDIDVNKLAKHFGGGGHYAASGCVIEKNMEEAEKLLLRQIKKIFQEQKQG